MTHRPDFLALILCPPRLVISLLIGAAVLLFGTEILLAQDLFVSGSGAPAANDQYKESGSIDGKPHFQLNGDSTAYHIAWSISRDRWELYNTFNGFTYYFSPFDTPLPPRSPELWGVDKGGSPPPTLSGPRTSGPLAGTYTVGGGTPDFLTISAAVDSLNSDGIFDDVTFAIRPGTYDEQVEIEYYPSYGSINDDVTITPESGTVDWDFTGAGVSNNYFVRVDSAKNITIDGIDFDDPGGAPTYATIVLFGDVDNLLIRNCTFDGVLNATVSTQSLINFFTVANSDVDIVDNTFVNGYYGVRGASDILVARNSFQRQDRGAILITFGNGLQILDNTIADWNSSDATYNGIGVTADNALVARNTLELIKGDAGIDVEGANPKVQNNMVAMLDASIAYGIDVRDSVSPGVYHNSVWIGASSAGAALRFSGLTPTSVFDNVFINEGGGFALSLDGGTSHVSNFNNLYTTGVKLVDRGPCCATLADWQASSGSPGPNSVSKAVSFVSTVSTVDLHLTGVSDGDMDLAGVPIGGITTDIDGNARSGAAPYMGAHEATPFTISVGLKVFLEGPFSAPTMSTTLNSGGHLDAAALAHPYGGAPWNYPGTESQTAGFFASNPTVVDWVYLKLYSGTLPSVTAVDSTVGLLLSNSNVVSALNVADSVAFNVAAGSYYVGVFHRNHLGIISKNTVNLALPSPSYDFTFGSASTYGTDPMKDLSGSTKFGMFAADASFDGQVTATDFNAWLVDTKAVATGYLQTDFNMDGQATASDFNLWLSNTKAVATSQVP